ncbi:MAG TPA: methionine--tRNA ligase [Terriglobia bacterium]|nr:methionine--tRNA ligase [Terriglobia bacterium]
MNQSTNQKMNKFYLTTPLYYPNARLHVGSAYTTIVCDVIARYKRMCGDDVAFLTGNDEHGEKLQRAADAAGVRPGDFVAEKRRQFIEVWKKLGIDYTHFVYTDQPEHIISVQRLIRLAQKNEPGVIYKGTYQGRYCVFDERYVSDGADPVNCDICGRPAELINEQNYFFRLSAFQDRLLELYEQHPEFVQPDFRRNEVISFVKSGLRDISISRRRLKWGIQWPDDPEEVVYVWYDALAGYMTGIGYAEGEQGSAEFQKLWPADVHMIGKDIIRFHAVYWPAFLMAAGLPLPKTVFAHGWIYYEQDKMSKSKGNVVYPEPIVDALDSFGAPGNDALRYYLLRDTPFGQDASFSYDGLVQRYNSDLANGLGNLASRTLMMVQQFRRGLVPKGVSIAGQQDIFLRLDNLIFTYQDAFDRWDLSGALGAIWDFLSAADKLIVEWKPWELAKSNSVGDQEKLDATLYSVANLLRVVSLLLYSVMPYSAERLWKLLGCEGDIKVQKFEDLKSQSLKPGTKVGKPEPIFPRLDKAEAVARLNEFAEADRKGHQAPTEKEKTVETPSGEKPANTEQAPVQPTGAPTATPASEKISIEDFAKVEMRVGEILAAESIPKADKLLKLQVDIGTEVRQVCAGIAEHYKPEQLVGMKVVLVTNLQPRKLRGVESNGMIVAASVGEEGRPVLATFNEDVPKGAKLR